MKQRFIRTGGTLDDAETVVRGGELVAAAVRRDALRMRHVYGVFGFSVFAVRGTTIDELAQDSPLVRFVRLTTLTAGTIRSAGLEIEAMGRNSLHYTVLLPDAEDAVVRLCACERHVVDNPYYEE